MIGATALLIAMLHCVYYFILVPLFAHQGYVIDERSLFLIAISFAIAVLVVLTLPVTIKLPSQLFAWIMFILVVCPVLVVATYTASWYTGSGRLYLLMVVFSAALMGNIWRFHNVTFGTSLKRITEVQGISIVVTITIIGGVFLFVLFGARGIPGIFDVYETRLGMRETLTDNSLGAGYIMRFLGNIANPFLIGYGLLLRKPLVLVVGLSCQLYLFTLDGTKHSLFAVLMIAGIVGLLASKKGSISGLYLLAGACLMVFASVATDYMLDNGFGTFVQLFVRRMFFVPGHLSIVYHEFFDGGPYFLWGGRFGADNEYAGFPSPGFIVGLYHFGGTEANANANLLADGFAQFGLLGVILSLCGALVVLWTWDALCAGDSAWVALILICIPAYAATNTGLFSLLGTHGLISGALLLALLRSVRFSDPWGSWAASERT